MFGPDHDLAVEGKLSTILERGHAEVGGTGYPKKFSFVNQSYMDESSIDLESSLNPLSTGYLKQRADVPGPS